MKQLLDTRNITIKKDDNELYHVTGTIIALDNHAYVILEEQDKDINNMNYTTYELLSCNNSTTVANDNEDTNNNKEKDNNDNKNTSNSKEKESSKTNNTKEKENDNGDTIESCCIYMTKGKESLDIYCGVAYKNKLLYIYHIPTSTSTCTPTPMAMADNPQDKSVIKIKSIIKYNTVRKVCSISFNTITDTRESKEESTNINNMGIFIADLQGDVTCYPLTTNNSKRILLGHTASILTGMKISNSSSNAQKGRKIITCDRDEKIRISSFPNCWYTLGYLLGHTDYISCIDIATTDDGTNICVSCSGDGTIKLWDYDTYKLLDTYPITTTTTNDNDNSDDENKNDDCSNDANYVYSYVSIHKSGKYIAAIKQQQQNANESTNGHNNNPIIELFTIEKNTTLKLIQTISSSMESLPISLLFLPSSKNNTVNDDNISLIVLCTQPNYILHYKYIPSSTNALFQDISSHKSYYHTVISKLGNENNITMPIESTRSNSNLEGGRNKVYIDFKWNTVGKRHVDRSRNNRRKYRKKNS